MFSLKIAKTAGSCLLVLVLSGVFSYFFFSLTYGWLEVPGGYGMGGRDGWCLCWPFLKKMACTETAICWITVYSLCSLVALSRWCEFSTSAYCDTVLLYGHHQLNKQTTSWGVLVDDLTFRHLVQVKKISKSWRISVIACKFFLRSLRGSFYVICHYLLIVCCVGL